MTGKTPRPPLRRRSISLAWLANKLIEHGKHLRAGDVVLTATVHPPAFLPGSGVAKTEFIGLGRTEITIK